MKQTVGFCAIYRFNLRSGSETSFKHAWSKMTEAIRAHRGGLGSRLHIDDDGCWVAYAQWPDRETWEKARELPDADTEAARQMADAIEERLPPILLDVNIDLFETS